MGDIDKCDLVAKKVRSETSAGLSVVVNCGLRRRCGSGWYEYEGSVALCYDKFWLAGLVVDVIDQRAPRE